MKKLKQNFCKSACVVVVVVVQRQTYKIVCLCHKLWTRPSARNEEQKQFCRVYVTVFRDANIQSSFAVDHWAWTCKSYRVSWKWGWWKRAGQQPDRSFSTPELLLLLASAQPVCDAHYRKCPFAALVLSAWCDLQLSAFGDHLLCLPQSSVYFFSRFPS